jgi:hypothetical protein
LKKKAEVVNEIAILLHFEDSSEHAGGFGRNKPFGHKRTKTGYTRLQ